MNNSFAEILTKIISDSTQKSGNSFVLIGGQARSGKSTIAKKISDGLKNTGITSTIICLDHWIVDGDKRDASFTVRERYDYDGIIESIHILLNEAQLLLNHYNPKSKAHTIEQFEYLLSKDDVLIIEGVPALDIKALRELSSTSIFIKIDETTRKQRFMEYYKSNGFSQSYILSLYKQRCLDEIEIIEKTSLLADFHLYVNKIIAL